MGGLFGGGGTTTKSSETPLSSLNIQSSAYGGCVPLIYGRNRVPANLIDYDDFQAIPHTTSTTTSGGKGGGGGTTMQNTSYTYATSFIMGLGEGPFHSINAFWNDKAYTANSDVFTKGLGTQVQTPWPQWTSLHPTKALAYRGLAYVAAAAYDLETSASIGNHSFDVTALLPYSAGVIDGANPKDIIDDYLTDPNHGAGFPYAYIGDWTPFSTWCIASNVFFSPIYDTQGEARQAITELLTTANSGIYFSEGLLKITPYGDTAVTGNGVTYMPNITPAYALGDDDYLDLDQPVRIFRTPNADAYNRVQIEFADSSSQYNAAIATAQDQASIELFGIKPMPVITAHWITDVATARLIAQLILQRVLYTRNEYEFKIGWKYCRLEPTDYVTLTDSRLGLLACPVRVLSVEEDEDGMLSIRGEDAPAGVAHSPLYASQGGSGYTVNYGVAPGDVVAPAFFETPAIKAMSGLMVGVAANGSSADWGGCEVWASNDGSSYAYVGRIDGGARYGVIGNSITESSGQVVRVTLAGRPGQIFTASEQDADNLSTLSIIDDEYVAYTGASLISAGVYDLTLLNRAAYSTTAAGHAPGARFVRVDDAIAYSAALDLPMIGKTLYFKFLSFNKWGGGKQQLADVTAYPYLITGVMAKLPPPAIYGLAVTSSANINIVTWNNPADATTDRVEVWRGTSSDVGTAMLAGSVRGPVGIFTDNVGEGGATYYYWVRAINLQQFPSGYLGPIEGTTGTISVTLPDGSVTTAKLATAAVTAVNIGDNEITAPKMAANSVTAAAIAANAIVAGKIAADAIYAANIVSGQIQASHLAANSVTAAAIQANSITADRIDTRGLSIKDASGNVILASGTALDWSRVGGAGRPASYADVTSQNTAAGIVNQGAFATINRITTYIADAYMDSLSVAGVKITGVQFNAVYLGANGSIWIPTVGGRYPLVGALNVICGAAAGIQSPDAGVALSIGGFTLTNRSSESTFNAGGDYGYWVTSPIPATIYYAYL